ncbi:MAG: CopG family transcriptional regulator [Verrucomicrobia bacterium]|nr:CopG family transcriptional regulator [Verrucomicrobiota bacterium]
MRTTVSLDNNLLAMAKREALKRHRSLASLVEESLRQMLAGTNATPKARNRVELPEDGEGGLQPGIDLDNSADLLLVMEKRDDSYGR